MEDKLQKTAEGIWQEHNFIGYVLASSAGKVLLQKGDFQNLKWKSLFDVLFGDDEAILRLFTFLEGKPLPQLYGQGEIVCLLFMPEPKLILGFFSQDERGSVALYLEGVKIALILKHASET